MVSKDIKGRLRRLYQTCQSNFSSWSNLQEQGAAQLSAVANALQMLPALQDKSCYGTLSDLPDISLQLLSKQVQYLEAVLADLRQTVSEMKAIQISTARLATDASRQLKAEKLPKSARTAALGAQPSLEECCSGLQTLANMMAKELLLKTALLESLTYESQADELDGLLEVFTGQPNMAPQAIADTLGRVLDTDFGCT